MIMLSSPTHHFGHHIKAIEKNCSPGIAEAAERAANRTRQDTPGVLETVCFPIPRRVP